MVNKIKIIMLISPNKKKKSTQKYIPKNSNTQSSLIIIPLALLHVMCFYEKLDTGNRVILLDRETENITTSAI